MRSKKQIADKMELLEKFKQDCIDICRNGQFNEKLRSNSRHQVIPTHYKIKALKWVLGEVDEL